MWGWIAEDVPPVDPVLAPAQARAIAGTSIKMSDLVVNVWTDFVISDPSLAATIPCPQTRQFGSNFSRERFR